MMTVAITRRISPRFNECEITHVGRTDIDLDHARKQHQDYVVALAELGCRVIELPEEADLPDSVFVEDTAFILPEAAVITRPGADSRKPETRAIEELLSAHLPLVRITEPATLDGGDVLVLGRNIYIGLSTRSNKTAIGQAQALLQPYAYNISGVRVNGCLHLKSAVTRIDDERLLVNRQWVDPSHFSDYELIDIDPAEPHAANCLPIKGTLLYPQAFPGTRRILEGYGYEVRGVNMEELAKAEGAVTCCSLIINEWDT